MPSTAPIATPPRHERDAGVPTGFGAIGPEAPGPARTAAAVDEAGVAFDVCHAGVVLRALLFVHGVLAIGTSFGASSPGGWALGLASASAAALPAVLGWLVVGCAARRRLARLPLAGQWGFALALGACCGALGALLAGLASADAVTEPRRWMPAALAGIAFGAGLFGWLRMRSAALAPAAAAARLAELQSRIRPHFLFNTLNTALALVRSDPQRAEAVLEDLAELFRVAITGNAESTSLAEELHLAERYLAIEQVRFGARLRLDWRLDPAAGAARVPPLLLQPLVENAVRHGVEPSGEGGSIRITTEVTGGRAQVSVRNSLSAVASTPGSGIALRNVRERLRLMHDVAAGFEVRRDARSYEVRIALPLA